MPFFYCWTSLVRLEIQICLFIFNVCVHRIMQQMKLLRSILSGLFRDFWRTPKGGGTSWRCAGHAKQFSFLLQSLTFTYFVSERFPWEVWARLWWSTGDTGVSVLHWTGQAAVYSRLKTGTLMIIGALKAPVPGQDSNTVFVWQQISLWVGDTPSVLEEFLQCVASADDFKVLLRGTVRRGELAKIKTSGTSMWETRAFNCQDFWGL